RAGRAAAPAAWAGCRAEEPWPGAPPKPVPPPTGTGSRERRSISTWMEPPGSWSVSFGLQDHDLSVESPDLHQRAAAGDRPFAHLDRPAGVLRLAVDAQREIALDAAAGGVVDGGPDRHRQRLGDR